MAKNTQPRKQPPGQRQLRVGEEIRHALSDVFMRGELYDPVLDGAPITVSQVKISPDLKNATAYVMPLGGLKLNEVMETLARLAPNIRNLVGHRLKLRYTPRISFRVDTSFEEAGRIHALLRQPEVLRDLETSEAETEAEGDE